MNNILLYFFQFCKSFLINRYYTLKFRKTDFFDYHKLANQNFCSVQGFAASTHYGNHIAIGNLVHKRINLITEYIEHGLSFYTDPEKVPLLGPIDRKCFKTIYTFSEQRALLIKEYLQRHHLTREVISVGPYILGAKHFRREEDLAILKKQYGRILLCFPSHSCETFEAKNPVDFLIEKIEEKRNEYDSVFICIYWMDILKMPQEIKSYEAKGYTVVTAGHRSDPHFLSRLKDIITLSDMVVTNGLGTHIGYSVSLGKPVYFIKNNNVQCEDTCKNDIEEITEKFADVFSVYSPTITPEQLILIEQYYGNFTH